LDLSAIFYIFPAIAVLYLTIISSYRQVFSRIVTSRHLLGWTQTFTHRLWGSGFNGQGWWIRKRSNSSWVRCLVFGIWKNTSHVISRCYTTKH